MFKWLRKKAADQCRFNVKLNAKTLVSLANQVDSEIEDGVQISEYQNSKVGDTQKRLLNDMKLGISNGIAKDEIINFAEDSLNGVEISKGARVALDHVYSYLES